MEFEDFKAKREWSNDLHSHFPEDVLPGSKGWLYCDNRLWIEDTTAWPEESTGRGNGQWYVRIGNQELQSDSLEECERPLFGFAESSGFFDSVTEG